MTFEEAKRKARYGHKDYIAIPTTDGEVYERLTVATLKRAMLAAGTKGKLYVIGASNAVLYAHSWRIGVNMMRNAGHLGIPAA